MKKLSPNSNIRWTSNRIILPEHRKALQEHKKQKNRIPKPILDEQELEQISFIIADSLYNNFHLSITYWDNYKYHTITGIVKFFDYINKTITVQTSEDIIKISINCLKHVQKL